MLVFAAMTKWFIEAPNSILDTEKAFLEIKDLAVAVRFHCLEKIETPHPSLSNLYQF